MSIILAIETSTELASVALLRDGQLLVRETSGTQNHSETVLPMIGQLLAEAGLALSQCDVIGFGEGPGSFTGVRTACGVVQGLAFGAGLPVVPVNTLAAMARACHVRLGQPETARIVPVLDARMSEIYWAQYHVSGGVWQTVVPATLDKPEDVAPQGQVVACGNGLSAYADAFADVSWVTGREAAVMPHAAQIAAIAAEEHAAGRALDASQAQPLYLRNKVALTTAERAVRDAAKGAA